MCDSYDVIKLLGQQIIITEYSFPLTVVQKLYKSTKRHQSYIVKNKAALFGSWCIRDQAISVNTATNITNNKWCARKATANEDLGRSCLKLLVEPGSTDLF